MSSIEFFRVLYEEYLDWYLSIAEGNGVLPRQISGFDADTASSSFV